MITYLDKDHAPRKWHYDCTREQARSTFEEYYEAYSEYLLSTNREPAYIILSPQAYCELSVFCDRKFPEGITFIVTPGFGGILARGDADTDLAMYIRETHE